MKQYSFIFKIIVIFALCFLVFSITVLCLRKCVSFNLIGSSEIKLDDINLFTDEGFNAKMCTFKKCFDLTEKVKISFDKINNSHYQNVYTLKMLGKKYTLKRLVIINDFESPSITLMGSDKVNICPNHKYVEEGFKAIDNIDGDITDNVQILNNQENITYTIADSSGNISSINRVLNIIDSYPNITILGNKTVYISIGDNYVEQGVSAYDECDGDITNRVLISGDVDSSKAGTYVITYQITNGTNTTKVERTVIVESKWDEIIKYVESKNYKVSLGYYNINTQEEKIYNGSKNYYGASLIKTLDALYIYKNNLVDNYTRELVKKAITISDNNAHKLLVDYIGFQNLKKFGNDLGATYTLVGNDNFGKTNVSDQLVYFKELYNYFLTGENSLELKKFFDNNVHNELKFSSDMTVLHKYGYYGKYYHNVGIFLTNEPYIVVILTEHSNNMNLITELSKLIYDYHTK